MKHSSRQHPQIVAESDMMRGLLQELGGVPNVLYQEGQTAPVTFALSNRFAQVMGECFD